MTKLKQVLISEKTPEALALAKALVAHRNAQMDKHRALHEAQDAEVEKFLQDCGLPALKERQRKEHDAFVQDANESNTRYFHELTQLLGLPAPSAEDHQAGLDAAYLEDLGFVVLQLDASSETGAPSGESIH